MNLLLDNWIPVRPLAGGEPEKITLQQLFCGQVRWILCLPRDDMELAALQLLICLVQVTWLPKYKGEFLARVRDVLNESDFQQGVAQWGETFRLDHPEYPFMQVKGVAAKEPTGMDKLMAGLTGATNSAFVNEPNQAESLCGGCAAIALFNQANNAPSFGGGFKSGLRGGSPVTTLIKGSDLRTTVWLNVLTEEHLDSSMPDWRELTDQAPTWLQLIVAGEKIPAIKIGLLRGLFWQPDHIELCPPVGEGQCSTCGAYSIQRYSGFLKAKFNFTVDGVWPHPHSPRVLQIKKGQQEEKFLAFTTSAPSWTQISRMLVAQQVEKGQEGHKTASVLQQMQQIWPGHRLHLIVGGYRNNQASILERRHEVLSFNQGWEKHPDTILAVVQIGLGYKTALRKALFLFAEGVRNSEIKGAGVAVQEVAEQQFYRQSDPVITSLLASLDFDQSEQILAYLRLQLRDICLQLFQQTTAPYYHHPKLVASMAIARRNLHKSLSELQPQGEKHDPQEA
ncbi:MULTISPECIES: type I-E CRISPR-associated protein Cse1/CasA [Marinomonas]|uniref:Type I-E CRISPR-associated protein Cse1/CasA n=1 Tax=Marinomonas rhodophyticola TaxID=2992803 RepID=A0ABT3KFG5_9GAMM|nr:type I-E CRISPR-associated protein Cse1/CasA [Marinomonas sp. KJ51-3]MCW4629270.1 type I-E CRISPR-associated protein Cse1/CasA [Marinomonas sp. KJ51-3]